MTPHLARAVALIGLRGSGKTSVGQLLAKRLGVRWVDTDADIVKRAEMSVRQIFETQGESHFRALETTALREALEMLSPSVLSVGGGAVLRTENRKLLRNRATCIWLTAGVDELHRRLAADPETPASRPTLTSRPPLEELAELLSLRGSIYRELATIEVDTTGKSVAEVVETIEAQLQGT